MDTINYENDGTWKEYLYRLQEEAPEPIAVKNRHPEIKGPKFYGNVWHGKIDRSSAEKLCVEDGCYLIRQSQNDENRHVFVLRLLGKVKNFKLFYENGKHFVGEKKFNSVYDLAKDGLITMYVEEKAKDYIQKMSSDPVYKSLNRYSFLDNRHSPVSEGCLRSIDDTQPMMNRAGSNEAMFYNYYNPAAGGIRKSLTPTSSEERRDYKRRIITEDNSRSSIRYNEIQAEKDKHQSEESNRRKVFDVSSKLTRKSSFHQNKPVEYHRQTGRSSTNNKNEISAMETRCLPQMTRTRATKNSHHHTRQISDPYHSSSSSYISENVYKFRNKPNRSFDHSHITHLNNQPEDFLSSEEDQPALCHQPLYKRTTSPQLIDDVSSQVMNHRNLTKKKDSRRNSRNKSSPIQAICYDIIDEDNYDVTYKENRTEILKAQEKHYRRNSLDSSLLNNSYQDEQFLHLEHPPQLYQQNVKEIESCKKKEKKMTNQKVFESEFHHYEKDHNFKLHTYRIQWCEYCGNFMWGFIQQGMQCSDCLLNVHKQCSKLVPSDCQPILKHFKHVFGVDLTTLVKIRQTQRPAVVDMCITEIERRGIDAEGIYRVPGCHDDMMKLKAAFDRDIGGVQMGDYNDVNTIAGLLKMYLRELPKPLLPFDLYSRFINAAKLSRDDGKIDAIKVALTCLPRSHYETLKYLIIHLGKVADASHLNQMTAENLGIVFGPTLLRAPESNIFHLSYDLNDNLFQQSLISAIISSRHVLFNLACS